MKSLFFLAPVAFFLSLFNDIFNRQSVGTDSVESYIATEEPIAKEGLLANIGPTGSKSSGAKAGIVIASPSTSDPNYLYTWVRDSSLVFKTIIDQFTRGEDANLRGLIDLFIEAETNLQQVANPSGSVTTGGLGEPKFNVNETAFTGEWGRPQRDGPALRATAFTAYANWLISNSNTSWVTSTIWPAIQLDLEYVANYWNHSTFDLWEEVSSSSFYTSVVQHRALREGAVLATKLGDDSVAGEYSTQADNIFCFLQSYWNSTKGYITSNTGGGRSGIDANSALASIHTFDPNAGCDGATFQPCSDRALSSLKVFVDSFRSIYKINDGLSSSDAVATGRYPEDVYYNGNPWYLTTFAVAEQLYDSIYVWDQQGNLTVTDTSLAFFKQFSSSIVTGTYSSSDSTYQTLRSSVAAFADGFVAINAKYTPRDGSLAEQFNRDTGIPLSARDLTWSYASALTAFSSRKGVVPQGWGAKGLQVPTVCHPNPGPQVLVTFNVIAYTQFGENIFLTGNLDALKSWSPDESLALSSAKYPVWSITVSLPANTTFQYKYIRKYNGNINWEGDPNNVYTTPSKGNYSINDTWRW